MGISKSRYALSFDFRIFYFPEVLLLGAYKELNFNSLKFENYSGDKEIVDYSYDLDVSEINSVVKSILLGEISYQLSNEDINWLEKFEAKLIELPSLLDNEKYTFNYLVLKLMMTGFNQAKALDIAKKYYQYLRAGKPVIPVSEVVASLDKIIDSKEYWITNRIHEYDKLEESFLSHMLENKLRYGYNFNYRYFEADYLRICNRSFSRENYLLNKEKSYTVRKPKKLEEQTPYIIDSYGVVIIAIINRLLNTKYQKFQTEKRFLNGLVSDMKNTLSYAIIGWGEEEKG